MKFRFRVLLPFLFLCSSSVARNKADSLGKILSAAKTDSARVQCYMDLFQVYKNANQDSGLKYARLAYNLSTQTNIRKGIALSSNAIAVFYINTGAYDSAIKYLELSNHIRQGLNDKKGMTDVLSNLGVAYDYKGDLQNAMRNYLLSLKTAEESNDSFAVARAYNNIGTVYIEQNQYDEALGNFTKSYQYREGMKDIDGMASCLNNIGDIYSHWKNKTKEQESYTRALDLARQADDSILLVGLLANLAEDYVDEGDYAKALSGYQEAIGIYNNFGDKQSEADVLDLLGGLYAREKDYQNMGLTFAKEYAFAKDVGYLDGLKKGALGMNEYFTYSNQADSAHRYLDLFVEYSDSLLSVRNSETTKEMEKKYESEKKQKEIELQQTKLDSQKSFIRWVVGGSILVILLVLGLAIFIYRNYSLKKKANAELAEKNASIEEKKKIVEEKNREIIDSIRYARHIQEAIIPTDDLVYEYLKECFVLYKPKDIVSGDFYWINKQENNVLFSVIDCTGHGVPGAFMSVMAYSAINAVVTKRPGIPPARFLNFLHDAVKENFSNPYVSNVNDGMDMALCMLDRTTMKLFYAGARMPLCIVRNGELIEVPADRQSISARTEETCEPFTHHEMQLQKGDNIYIFSDGYADQFGGPKGKKFKYSNLVKLLVSISSQPIYKQKQLLDKNIEEWRGNLEQVDDICVMGVRV